MNFKFIALLILVATSSAFANSGTTVYGSKRSNFIKIDGGAAKSIYLNLRMRAREVDPGGRGGSVFEKAGKDYVCSLGYQDEEDTSSYEYDCTFMNFKKFDVSDF